MKKGKEVKISYWAAHATTIVSVTMVLLIIGIIAIITTSARRETVRLRESLEISVIMADSISDEGAAATAALLRKEPFCRDVRVITSAQALEEWKKETGEDLEALFGVNPLSPELTFTMPAAYSAPDSLKKVEAAIRRLGGIEDIAMPEGEMVMKMNDNISRLSLILGAIAVVMLVISFVLINNTVHLTVYARRFIIHTMQLVGATNGFIRRPVVLRNLLAGLLAGLIASGLLVVVMALAPEMGFSDIQAAIGWETVGVTAAGITILGAVLCALAASIATTRYLRKDYDALFR
ncbi:MAG: hypothetical protein HDR80_00960 [Bacteroides sp.]|nr:hypothetical protein [Bacteroides sp.]